jgi:hypothetical protein
MATPKIPTQALPQIMPDDRRLVVRRNASHPLADQRPQPPNALPLKLRHPRSAACRSLRSDGTGQRLGWRRAGPVVRRDATALRLSAPVWVARPAIYPRGRNQMLRPRRRTTSSCSAPAAAQHRGGCRSRAGHPRGARDEETGAVRPAWQPALLLAAVITTGAAACAPGTVCACAGPVGPVVVFGGWPEESLTVIGPAEVTAAWPEKHVLATGAPGFLSAPAGTAEIRCACQVVCDQLGQEWRKVSGPRRPGLGRPL